jgi:hypothetical protein
MDETKYEGKILTFFELIDESSIEVPIIQRDYAQGRIDKTEIRQNFLKALFDSLKNETPIKLDFIYGSKLNDSFQPLDGQQRLTTLFLLHWYAASQTDNPEQNKNKLKKFTYETRITSREFCQELINNEIAINNADDNLSSSIIDSNWFFLSWKKDPTIDSMLRTIDDIHKFFKEIGDLWELLTSDKQLISFYHVLLENIGLTDDLYIKMNARGRLLTPFENFKAGLQKEIKDNNWEGGVDHLEKFSFKIDNIWTDYFWSNFKKQNSIDIAHMRFISAIAMIRATIERTSDRFSVIQNLHDHPENVKPIHFSKEAFNYLVSCYETYCKPETNSNDLTLEFPMWRHEPNESILSEIVYETGQYSQASVNSASYTLIVLFFAQTEYLTRVSDFNRSYFREWMRVVRNIVSRGDIDKDGKRPDIIRSPQTFDGVINLISELATGCENIYKYLDSISNTKSTFAKYQIVEELKKSKLIVNKPSLKELIWKTEDNELLRGRIDFVLYCIDYKDDLESLNEEALSKVQQVFEKYFNSETKVSNVLRRAMLTIEVNSEYEFYNYWWSFWTVGNATKRRLFDGFREIEYFIESDQKEYFKKLVLQLLDKDYDSIINDFVPPTEMPNWKKRLIKEHELLDTQGKSKYIAIPGDNSCCYLLKSKRPRDMEGCVKID